MQLARQLYYRSLTNACTPRPTATRSELDRIAAPLLSEMAYAVGVQDEL